MISILDWVGLDSDILQVLGTPTREEIRAMNSNYSEFKFPQIKAHPWKGVFRSRTPPEVKRSSGSFGFICCCPYLPPCFTFFFMFVFVLMFCFVYLIVILFSFSRMVQNHPSHGVAIALSMALAVAKCLRFPREHESCLTIEERRGRDGQVTLLLDCNCHNDQFQHDCK